MPEQQETEEKNKRLEQQRANLLLSLNNGIVQCLENLVNQTTTKLNYTLKNNDSELACSYKDHLNQLRKEAERFKLDYACVENYTHDSRETTYEVTLSRVPSQGPSMGKMTA